MSRLYFRFALLLIAASVGACTWVTWGSPLVTNDTTLLILATAASIVSSILGLALGVSFAMPGRREVEAGRLRRLDIMASLLLGVGLLCVSCTTVGPLHPRVAAIALGLGAGLGVGAYAVVLGLLAGKR